MISTKLKNGLEKKSGWKDENVEKLFILKIKRPRRSFLRVLTLFRVNDLQVSFLVREQNIVKRG